MQSIALPCYNQLLEQLEIRNSAQTSPFIDIYKSYNDLWSKYNVVESRREEIRHQLALLEHETKELVDKFDLNGAVYNFRKKLELLQPYHSGSAEIRAGQLPLTNLSRTIYEQRKLIANQVEEMKVMKDERSEFMERHAELELNYKRQNEAASIQGAELASTLMQLQQSKEAVARLELECAQLVKRILNDKVRTAEELNDMNAHVEAIQSDPNSQKIANRPSTLSNVSTMSAPPSIMPTNATTLPLSGLHKAPIPSTFSQSIQCHATDTDINDFVLTNESILVTAGSDSVVNIRDISTLSTVTTTDISLSGSNKSTYAISNLAATSVSRTLLCGGAVRSLEMSQNDPQHILILGACGDNVCRIWNLNTGKLRCTLSAHTSAVTSAVFVDAQSDLVLSGSLDRNLKLWDIKNANAATLWNVKTDSPLTAVAVDSSTSTRVFTGHSDGSIHSWDINSGQRISTVQSPLQTSSSSTAVSNSGNVITNIQVHVTSGYMLSVCRGDHSINMYETRNGRIIHKLKEPGYKVSKDTCKACFSPQGDYIAGGSADGMIYIWSTLTGLLEKCLNEDVGHSKAIITVKWDSRGIISSDVDGRVLLWK